jgi:hypothetical protein
MQQGFYANGSSTVRRLWLAWTNCITHRLSPRRISDLFNRFEKQLFQSTNTEFFLKFLWTIHILSSIFTCDAKIPLWHQDLLVTRYI